MARNADMEFRIDANVTGIPSLQQAERAVRSLEGQMRRSSVVANQFGGALGGVGKDIRKSVMGGLQQAGYQVGDFAVQVANGTSKMQAFGQQGAQFFGIFGPIGAVIGAGIAIVSAFAVAAQKTKEATSKASGEIADLAASVSSYSSAVSLALTPTDDLADKYGRAAQKARELFEANAKLKQLDAIESLTASARRLQEEFGNFGARTSFEIEEIGSRVAGLVNKIDELRAQQLVLLKDPESNARGIIQISNDLAEINNQLLEFGPTTAIITSLQEKLGVSADQALAFAINLAKINEVGSPQELSDTIDQARQSFTELVGGAENMNDEQRDLLRQLVLTSIEALNLETNMVKAGSAAKSFNESSLERVLWVQREEQLMQQIVGLNQTSLDIERQRKENLAQLVANQASMARIMMSISADPEERLMARDVGINSDALAKAKEFFAELERNAKEAAKIGDPLGDLTKRISAERELLRATDAERQVRMAIYNADRKYSPEMVQNAIDLVQAYETELEALEKIKSANEAVASTIENSMTDAFMAIVDGTKKPIEAFKDMARLIIAELYKVLVVQQMVGSVEKGTGLAGALGKALGFRAMGGPITAGRPYMVGERGPELIVPSRNASVIPNNQLSAGGVTVNQNISFGAGVSRAEIQAMLPRIVETTKAAVFDAQRRSVTGRGYA